MRTMLLVIAMAGVALACPTPVVKCHPVRAGQTKTLEITCPRACCEVYSYPEGTEFLTPYDPVTQKFITVDDHYCICERRCLAVWDAEHERPTP